AFPAADAAVAVFLVKVDGARIVLAHFEPERETSTAQGGLFGRIEQLPAETRAFTAGRYAQRIEACGFAVLAVEHQQVSANLPAGCGNHYLGCVVFDEATKGTPRNAVGSEDRILDSNERIDVGCARVAELKRHLCCVSPPAGRLQGHALPSVPVRPQTATAPAGIVARAWQSA